MNFKVGILGLGYVGLPLAVASAREYETIGFDINQSRVKELQSGIDKTLEVNEQELNEAHKLNFTSKLSELAKCNFYIITVPTPIDEHKNPDLSPLKAASKTVGSLLSKGDIVVYESTVFPGCTEEECVPILEKTSGLKFNKEFFCGYSPERINPGDKKHRIWDIRKVTSGSTEEIASKVDEFYSTIISAGTFKAPSIKVAEAAKVIENAQRDINIAFVNELALIFERMGIDTLDVLEAAGTKWNFLPFKPGLVGGHCIGVDPYYLTHKAKSLGYHAKVILSGREINDSMGKEIANRFIKMLGQKRKLTNNFKTLILGFTFKENCPDVRNTRVIDIYHELKDYNLEVDVYDPLADPKEVKHEYGIDLVQNINDQHYDGVIAAVAHDTFLDLDWQKFSSSVVFDVKGFLSRDVSQERL